MPSNVDKDINSPNKRGTMSKERLEKTMRQIAEANGVGLTKKFDKIVNAKDRFGIGLGCPCDRDNEARFCISKQCLQDIKETGHCHCSCFCKVNIKKMEEE